MVDESITISSTLEADVFSDSRPFFSYLALAELKLVSLAADVKRRPRDVGQLPLQ